MESLRQILSEMGHVLNDYQWQNLQLRIREAVGPSVDEICAALQELAKSRGESGAAITLYNNRMGVVEVSTAKYPFGDGNALATIREATSPPEPTPKEDFETIICYMQSEMNLAPVEKARDALARICKLVTSTTTPPQPPNHGA